MDKGIKFDEFIRYLFDDEKLTEQGSKIIQALLEARSPHLTNISEEMAGKSESYDKSIQRFLVGVDLN